MEDDQELVRLKEADEVACNTLNTIAKTHQDLPMALMIVTLMYARLRFDAKVQGADPQEVDDLFTHQVEVFTNALEEEDGS